MVAPRCKKSKPDTELPLRAKPITENADPRRAKVLRDRELPSWNKSKTASAAPKRAPPLNDNADPRIK
jgi:hypothetical protein